jgi:hypothetical protein
VEANVHQDVFFKVEADGSDWEKDQKSIPQFQIGLWSLEALYKLQRSLRESVGSVLQAKKELLIQINEVKPQLGVSCYASVNVIVLLGARQEKRSIAENVR